MTPETHTKIVDFLTANGFSFGDTWGTQHGEGLPSGIRVCPNHYKRGLGAETVLVTATNICRYTIKSPTNYTSYYPIGTPIPYSSPDELLAVLKREDMPEKGCW